MKDDERRASLAEGVQEIREPDTGRVALSRRKSFQLRGKCPHPSRPTTSFWKPTAGRSQTDIRLSPAGFRPARRVPTGTSIANCSATATPPSRPAAPYFPPVAGSPAINPSLRTGGTRRLSGQGGGLPIGPQSLYAGAPTAAANLNRHGAHGRGGGEHRADARGKGGMNGQRGSMGGGRSRARRGSHRSATVLPSHRTASRSGRSRRPRSGNGQGSLADAGRVATLPLPATENDGRR